ncbi:MAG: glycyl-tRNA synthetase beta chain [Rickettsiales bacterium]|jgi:glycyl-tRNA synthetase beta chain
MSELLIEIYSEEIPARMQQKALGDFKKIFIELFNKQNIKFSDDDLKTFITPRRLTLLVQNLDPQQTGKAINRIGPKTSAPDQAIQGFLRSVSLKSVSDLKIINRDNGEYYSFERSETQIDTKEIIQKNLKSALQKMAGTWIKTMDLIDQNKQSNWVRPIRNILAIFDGEILDLEFANLKANDKTFGHLLAGKKSLQITDFADYEKKLEDNCVILDWDQRRKTIADDIAKIDQNSAQKNSKLIDEIAGLTEYPQVLLGSIEDQFNALPEEVLELVIKLHQKAIVLKNNQSLKFIFVSNVKASEEDTKKIIYDNEKVVKARLADAKFFIEEDLKIPFQDRIELLKNITFHKKLGSLYSKIKRLENLNKFVVIWVPKANLSMAEKLADLAKNDLSTKTVAELPELQGIVGSYYARNHGEAEEICQAISEQYLPIGQNSSLPQSPLGIVLAISDKIDTICGLFLAGEKPNASKDPFALRRSALGIIKIIFENELFLPLKIIIHKAINNYPNKDLKTIYPDKDGGELKEVKKEILTQVTQFFIERNKAYLKEQYGLRTDIVNQVFDEFLQDKQDKKCDLLEISKKAIFINNFIGDKSNLKVIDLYKRAANIVAIESKKDGKDYSEKASLIALKTLHEKSLFKNARIASKLVKKHLKHKDHNQAMIALMTLETSIKEFFDNVQINCDNDHLRANRLMILSKIKHLFEKVFDFSKIEL